MVLHEGALTVFGGHTAWTEADKSEHEKVHDDVWRLDLVSSQVGPAPPPAACGAWRNRVRLLSC